MDDCALTVGQLVIQSPSSGIKQFGAIGDDDGDERLTKESFSSCRQCEAGPE